MYLAMRFANTKEFDSFTVGDWLENKKWFDIKLLVDATRSDADHCKPMANNTYADAVKSTLRGLSIPSNHWVHIGRVLGPKILELLEEESDDIRRLGNWNPSIQESSYSIKLPLRPMRKLAGYTTANGMYFNARTTVIPSEELRKKTPFAFAISILPQVKESLLDDEGATDSTGQTALGFLKFMDECATIFLQDAAAMMIRKPERRDHPLFRRLDVFQTAEWDVSFFRFFRLIVALLFLFPLTNFVPSQSFVDKMRVELTSESVVSPLNHNVEAVLPGLHQRWAQTHNLVSGLKTDVVSIKTDIKAQVERMELSNRSQKEAMSDFLVQFGQSLREDGGRQVTLEQRPSPMEEEDDSSPTLRPPTTRFNIKQRHDSVSQMYHEWWGTGAYENKPIRGGFEAMEKLHRSRWRQHFDGGQVKHISRVKIVLNALNTLAEMEGNTLETALNEFDAAYKGQCKKYITKMEAYVKSKGYYQKKKRRGKRAATSITN
jgi:hypothetical protein